MIHRRNGSAGDQHRHIEAAGSNPEREESGATIAPEPDEMGRSAEQEATLVEAANIVVDASWGRIYGPVNLTVRRGGVTILVGHGGRGRTALLLTLAGRMKPTSGQLQAFGEKNKPHRLFRNAGVGFIEEVDGIGQAIRVHDVITETVRWTAKWWRWVPQATQEQYELICRPVFGDLDLPKLDSMVEELPQLTAALLRVAIANVHKPPLLVVGGVDNLTSISAANKFLERLSVLGREQTIITADINGRHEGIEVRDYIPVPNLTNTDFVGLLETAGIDGFETIQKAGN